MVRRDELNRALGTLERVGGKVLGLVANRLPVKGPDAYHYAYASYQSDAQLDEHGEGARKGLFRRGRRRRNKRG